MEAHVGDEERSTSTTTRPRPREILLIYLPGGIYYQGVDGNHVVEDQHINLGTWLALPGYLYY